LPCDKTAKIPIQQAADLQDPASHSLWKIGSENPAALIRKYLFLGQDIKRKNKGNDGGFSYTISGNEKIRFDKGKNVCNRGEFSLALCRKISKDEG